MSNLAAIVNLLTLPAFPIYVMAAREVQREQREKKLFEQRARKLCEQQGQKLCEQRGKKLCEQRG